MTASHTNFFSVMFVVDKWRGDLLTTTNETTDARFFSHNALPEIPEMYHETLTDFDGV